MPDGKITRQKVRDHLRRLWAVYLAGIIAVVFLNHLVYTVSRPGYSDEEKLEIMLVNADVSLDEEKLLEKTRHLGFEAVEILPLTYAPDDAASQMLLITQIVGGNGDVYICDAAGLELLKARNACHAVLDMENGLHLAAAETGSDTQSAVSALEIIAKELGE